MLALQALLKAFHKNFLLSNENYLFCEKIKINHRLFISYKISYTQTTKQSLSNKGMSVIVKAKSKKGEVLAVWKAGLCLSPFLSRCLNLLLCLSLCLPPVSLKAQTPNSPSTLPVPDFITEPTQSNAPTLQGSLSEMDSWGLLSQKVQAHPQAGQLTLEHIQIVVKQKAVDAEQTRHVHEIHGHSLSDAPFSRHITFEALFYEEDHLQTYFEMQFEEDVFWSFHKNLVTVARYGHYVVFITTDDIHDTHIRLSFIDLSYFKSALGQSDGYLAVFQMPIPLERTLHSMTIADGLLKVNDYEISRQMLDEFGYLQSLVWNVQAHLLKAETFEQMHPHIDGLLESLEDSQQAVADLLVQNIPLSNGHPPVDQVKEFSTQMAQSLMATRAYVARTHSQQDRQSRAFVQASQIGLQYLPSHQEAQAQRERTLNVRREARRFLGRTTLLFESLKLPLPNEGRRLRDALLFVLARSSTWQIHDGLVRWSSQRQLTIGATASVTLLGSLLYPEEAYQYLYQIVGFGRIFLESVHEKFMATYEVVKAAVSANGLFHPRQMWEAYMSDTEISRRFLIANAVLTLGPLLFFALSNLTVNAIYFLSDLRRQGSRNQSTLENFIHLQDMQRQNYLISQASSFLDSQSRDFTQEETQAVIGLLKERRELERGSISRFLDRVKAPLRRIQFFQDSEGVTDTRIHTLWGSLQNCFFSLQALERTYTPLTYFWWRDGYLARTYVWKPFTLLGYFYYPNALRTMTHEGWGMTSPHPLTMANGGLRPFWRQHPLALAKLFGRGPYQAYQEFERLILPIEAQIMRQVQQTALNATLQRIQNNTVQVEFDGTSNMDEVLEALSREQTKFYALVVDQLFKKVFTQVMAPVFERQTCGMSIEDCLEQIDSYKAGALDALRSFRPSSRDIAGVIRNVEDESFYEHIQSLWDQPVRRSWFDWFQSRVQAQLLRNLDPNQNASVAEWLRIEAQMQDAGSRYRATRRSFYQMFEKIPQLFITWAAVSGIMISSMAGDISSNDILVPLTDHFPYFSEYLFGAGFFVAVILDMLSQYGRNLRIEHHLNEKGVFHQIPEGAEVDMSFLSWFWKQLRNKDNTFVKNVGTIWRMTWANIPAQLTSFALIYGFLLGRFPLDAYVMMYFLYFAFPIYGWNIKVDQAMEGTVAGYWLGKIPKELRDHPLIQEDNLKRKNKAMGIYHFFSTFLYINTLEATLSNIQMMAVNTSREFARIVSFGHPPTVWAVKAFDAIRESIGEFPFVRKVVDTCQFALTNGYDGWDPSRDGPPPEGITAWEAKK